MQTSLEIYEGTSENAVTNAAYIFIIEAFIFLLVAVGVVVNDGLPVLPVTVLVVFFVAWLLMIVVLMAVRLGFPKLATGPLASNPPCVTLSLLQGGVHVTLASFINLMVLAGLTLSYTGSLKDQYFAVLFKAHPAQKDLWYLSRSSVVVMLAASVVIVGCLLAVFSILREYVRHKEYMRCHFMGFVNAYIFFNIALMFIMQNSLERVCAGMGEACDLSGFIESQSIEFINVVLYPSAYLLVMILDFMAEVGYAEWHKTSKHARPLLGVYIGARLIQTLVVWTLYVLSTPFEEIIGSLPLFIFPLWFRVSHACMHSIAVVVELTTAFTSLNISSQKKKHESGIRNGQTTALDLRVKTDNSDIRSDVSEQYLSSRIRPQIFFSKKGSTLKKFK